MFWSFAFYFGFMPFLHCLLFRRHDMGSFAFSSASRHGFFAFILASCHFFIAFYFGVMPWVHLPLFWLHAISSLPFISVSCHGFICLFFGFTPCFFLPLFWLHAMGSLPFIPASHHGFIAISFGFIAMGLLPIQLPSGTPSRLPSCTPQSICLFGTPFAFWHPICLLVPHSIRCAITIPMTKGHHILLCTITPIFFLKIP